MYSYVARQPILDSNQELVAYELLFRDGESNYFPNICPDQATSNIITNNHLNMGVEKVTGDLPAFINFHADTLIRNFPSFLDPEKVVIEGVAKPELFLYQPKEIIAISNIVEESFYAQTRPNILRIIPVRNQEKSLGSYNFIEFQEPDNIKLAIDRIQDIEVKLFTRKGDFVDFVNENDDLACFV